MRAFLSITRRQAPADYSDRPIGIYITFNLDRICFAYVGFCLYYVHRLSVRR